MDLARTAQRRSRTPSWELTGILIPCAIGLLFVVFYVLRSGTWLDDYWQLWISGAPNGLLVTRLVGDQHPPWFNLFGRIIVAITGGNIWYARSVNLAAAVAALAIGLRAIPELEAALRWRIFLLVVTSAGLIGLTDLAATFRVYPWLLVLAALQGAFLLAIADRREVRGSTAALVTTLSIALHYAHAIGAIAIATVTIFIAWRRKQYKSAGCVASGMILATLIDLAVAFVQLPQWSNNFDVNWIGQRDFHSWSLLSALLTNYLMFNLVAAVLILMALLWGDGKRMLLVLAPIPLALAVWLLFDAFRPILVPRYLASICALFSVAAAVGWTDLRLRSPASAAIALLAAFQPLFYALLSPPRAGLEEGARIAGAITSGCPQARTYGIPAWRFRDRPDSKTARFESPVMEFAYSKVGRSYGIRPQIVSAPTRIALGGCPLIVWMDTAKGIDRVPAAVVLRHAQLEVAGPFAGRFEPTENGAVLLITQPDRLGRSE